MRYVIAVIFSTLLFLAKPIQASECISVIKHEATNPIPLSWFKSGLIQNGVCGTLISMPTVSSGYKDKLHKRGRRDTLVMIPNSLRPTHESIDIIYWFHGLTGFSKRTFQVRLAPQYAWLVNNQSYPAILVVVEMPWSRFTRTQWKRQGRVFRKPDEFLKYTKEVEGTVSRVAALREDFRFDRVIVGHSAGGSAIASAAKYGGLCRANPTGIVFSDSTYGRWFDSTWNGCVSNYFSPKVLRIMVLGQSFGRPWKCYTRWAKRHSRSCRKIEAHRLKLPWTHQRIGDNAIPFFYGRFNDNKYKNIYEK